MSTAAKTYFVLCSSPTIISSVKAVLWLGPLSSWQRYRGCDASVTQRDRGERRGWWHAMMGWQCLNMSHLDHMSHISALSPSQHCHLFEHLINKPTTHTWSSPLTATCWIRNKFWNVWGDFYKEWSWFNPSQASSRARTSNCKLWPWLFRAI